MEELATQIRDMSGEGTVGRLIESVNAAFSPEQTVAETLQAVTKLKGAVKLVPPGTLPNDGKVIADERPVG